MGGIIKASLEMGSLEGLVRASISMGAITKEVTSWETVVTLGSLMLRKKIRYFIFLDS